MCLPVQHSLLVEEPLKLSKGDSREPEPDTFDKRIVSTNLSLLLIFSEGQRHG